MQSRIYYKSMFHNGLLFLSFGFIHTKLLSYPSELGEQKLKINESCMRLIFHSESNQGTEIWVLFENSLSNITVSAPLLTSYFLNMLSETVYKHILSKTYPGQKQNQRCKDATWVKNHLLSSTPPGPREITRMLQRWRFSFRPVPQFSYSWSISADMFVNTWSWCCGAGFHLSCSCLPQTLRRAGVPKVPGRGTKAPYPRGQRAGRGGSTGSAAVAAGREGWQWRGRIGTFITHKFASSAEQVIFRLKANTVLWSTV